MVMCVGVDKIPMGGWPYQREKEMRRGSRWSRKKVKAKAGWHCMSGSVCGLWCEEEMEECEQQVDFIKSTTAGH